MIIAHIVTLLSALFLTVVIVKESRQYFDSYRGFVNKLPWTFIVAGSCILWAVSAFALGAYNFGHNLTAFAILDIVITSVGGCVGAIVFGNMSRTNAHWVVTVPMFLCSLVTFLQFGAKSI